MTDELIENICKVISEGNRNAPVNKCFCWIGEVIVKHKSGRGVNFRIIDIKQQSKKYLNECVIIGIENKII